MKSNLAALRKIRSMFFIAAIAGVSLTSCKDDENKIDPDGGNKPAEKAPLPEKGQLYRYSIKDAETTSSSVLKVVGVRDSSGISVLDIEEEFSDEESKFTLHNRAYSHGGTTTYEINAAAGLNSLVAYIDGIADILDYELTGLPQKRMIENKTDPGSKITFSAKPVTMRLDLEIPTEEGPLSARIDAKVTYASGQLVKEETITTPAGSFKCSKWEYTYELYTKLSGEIPVEESTVEYTVSLWTAPGIGVVKSVEASGNDVTTTELQKIDKQ